MDRQNGKLSPASVVSTRSARPAARCSPTPIPACLISTLLLSWLGLEVVPAPSTSRTTTIGHRSRFACPAAEGSEPPAKGSGSRREATDRKGEPRIQSTLSVQVPSRPPAKAPESPSPKPSFQESHPGRPATHSAATPAPPHRPGPSPLHPPRGIRAPGPAPTLPQPIQSCSWSLGHCIIRRPVPTRLPAPSLKWAVVGNTAQYPKSHGLPYSGCCLTAIVPLRAPSAATGRDFPNLLHPTALQLPSCGF